MLDDVACQSFTYVGFEPPLCSVAATSFADVFHLQSKFMDLVMLDWRSACTLEKKTVVHIKNNNDTLTSKTTTTIDNKIQWGKRWRCGEQYTDDYRVVALGASFSVYD